MREELAHITPGTRAPGRPRPPKAMGEIRQHALASDTMLHDVRRQPYDKSELGSDTAQHVVFGQIVFHAFKAADREEYAFPSHDRGSDSEFWPFHHDRCEQTGMEICIHAQSFEARPDRFT